MIFLGFLAQSSHLQLLTDDEYKKLMTEMPVALKALRGNTLNNQESPIIKGKRWALNNKSLLFFIARSESVSSTSTTPVRPRNRSNTGQ
jgi:hypothetical protein